MSNELYVWFCDSFVESISVKSLFIMRLLNYCQIEFKPKWIALPQDMKNLETELKHLPILKVGEQTLRPCEIISLCKETAKEKQIPLSPEERSLATRILFEWSTTNLVGLYTQILCTEPMVKERIFKDYQAIYKPISEDLLEKVSQTMLRLNAQTEDISCLSQDKKEHALEILRGFEAHLIGKKYWLGEEISICDFSLFSFCYQLYNPQLVFFRDYLKGTENILPWMKRIDSLSRNTFSKMKA